MHLTLRLVAWSLGQLLGIGIGIGMVVAGLGGGELCFSYVVSPRDRVRS